MKRRVCQECIEKHELGRNEEVRFPTFMALGGVLGVIGGLAMGPVVLVPAGLLGGLAVDIVRCEICGSDRDEIFELTIEDEDKYGETIFKFIPPPPDEEQDPHRYEDSEDRVPWIENADDFLDAPEIEASAPDEASYEEGWSDTADSFAQAGPSGGEPEGTGEGGMGLGAGDLWGAGGSESGTGDGGSE